MKTVSVIIPNYNRAQDLLAAVMSVLAQTYPVLEVIVCDDGSTDNGKELITALNDSRVQWLDCGKNGMPSIPRNKGIAQSKGEWLAFLDNDDAWHPEKLAKQMDALEKTRLLASSTNAYRINHEGKNLGVLHSHALPAVLTMDELIHINWVICSSAIIHCSLLDKVIGFPESPTLRALEDYALWLRVASITSFAYVDEALVNYKDLPQQSIRANDDGKYIQRERIFDNFYRWCQSTRMSEELTKRARKMVRHAMRHNGKSIFERLRYK